MSHTGNRAIVLGASISGLLAARILSDYYDTVIVLERDIFPAVGESRKGVPQSNQIHGLHARGREVLETLFPNFTADMVAQGGISMDISRDFHWHANAGFHAPTDSGLIGLLISRPRLEAGIRARVQTLPNVTIVENCDVRGLVNSDDHARVLGVRVVERAKGDDETSMIADLVVDATGRGSRTPAWLRAMGYNPPTEERMHVDISYASCFYERTPAQVAMLRGGTALAGEVATGGRNGVLVAQEGDRWGVTLCGMNGDFPPLDHEGYVEFAKGLPSPILYNFLKDAKPIGQPVQYRFAASQRRRYEQMASFPEGYLVFGDAIASFNPVYAQGMTVAANEAMILQTCLDQGNTNLAPRFFKAVKPIIDAPWSIASGADLQFAHVDGKRTPMTKFLNWYIGKLHIAAREDGELSVKFLRIVNMLEAPPALLHPSTVWRVIRGNLKQRKSASAQSTTSATLAEI